MLALIFHYDQHFLTISTCVANFEERAWIHVVKQCENHFRLVQPEQIEFGHFIVWSPPNIMKW